MATAKLLDLGWVGNVLIAVGLFVIQSSANIYGTLPMSTISEQSVNNR
jgi:hypothetical protein